MRQSVFIWDPLERFLSGFLDKCVDAKDHCQPRNTFVNKETSSITDYFDNPQRVFEIYVDTMPMEWDIHFIPQSLYCNGLYRTIHTEYDFVGYMDGNFYQHLEQFGDQFQLQDDVDLIFSIKPIQPQPPQLVLRAVIGVRTNVSKHPQSSI